MTKRTITTEEVYQDGELVQSRPIGIPRARTAIDMAMERIAELEIRLQGVDTDELDAKLAKIEEIDTKLTGIDVTLAEKFARIEERMNRAASQAASINPNAVEDPGARSQVQKVKDALVSGEEVT